MTFASLYDLYKQDCALHLKQSTMASKFAMIEKHILPGFKALHVNAITPATVRAWQNEVLSKGYSPSYCYSLHRQLSAILNFACRYYGLQANPAARAGSIGRNEVHQAFWTINDFRRFAMTLTSPAQIMLNKTGLLPIYIPYFSRLFRPYNLHLLHTSDILVRF